MGVQQQQSQPDPIPCLPSLPKPQDLTRACPHRTPFLKLPPPRATRPLRWSAQGQGREGRGRGRGPARSAEFLIHGAASTSLWPPPLPSSVGVGLKRGALQLVAKQVDTQQRRPQLPAWKGHCPLPPSTVPGTGVAPRHLCPGPAAAWLSSLCWLGSQGRGDHSPAQSAGSCRSLQCPGPRPPGPARPAPLLEPWGPLWPLRRG